MQKTHFKILLATILFVLPFSASARVLAPKPPHPEICRKIESLQNQKQTQAAALKRTLATKHNFDATHFIEISGAADEALTKARATEDTAFAAQIAALMTHADTPAKVAAVETFEATMRQAITARRVANDTALINYRTAITATLEARTTKIETLVSTLAERQQTALGDGRKNCQNNARDPHFAQMLKSNLEEANNNFRDAKQDLDMNSDIAGLNKIKQDAILAAETTFKATLATATATLRTALK